MVQNIVKNVILEWGWRHENIWILLLQDFPCFPLGYAVSLALGLCLCCRYHLPGTWSQTKFIMQFTVHALPFPSWFSGTAEEVCSLEKWEYYLALSSDLIELGQSERPNSYEQISEGKSTLRKHLVCYQADKCDNSCEKRSRGLLPNSSLLRKNKKCFNKRIKHLDKRQCLKFFIKDLKDRCKSLLNYLLSSCVNTATTKRELGYYSREWCSLKSSSSDIVWALIIKKVPQCP